jgi:hypothetical protein
MRTLAVFTEDVRLVITTDFPMASISKSLRRSKSKCGSSVKNGCPLGAGCGMAVEIRPEKKLLRATARPNIVW